jgi:hypothetical protein
MQIYAANLQSIASRINDRQQFKYLVSRVHRPVLRILKHTGDANYIHRCKCIANVTR